MPGYEVAWEGRLSLERQAPELATLYLALSTFSPAPFTKTFMTRRLDMMATMPLTGQINMASIHEVRDACLIGSYLVHQAGDVTSRTSFGTACHEGGSPFVFGTLV